MISKEKILEGLKSSDGIRRYYSQFIREAAGTKDEITVCSPLRKDNDPSFSLNLKTGLWHDFATGDSGDIITFVQKKSRCDFPNALNELAHFAGLLIGNSVAATPKRSPINNKTITLINLQRWIGALFSPAGKTAKEYLNSRGLCDDTLKNYKIGFDVVKKAVVIPLDSEGDHVTALKRFHFEGKTWKMSNGKKIVTTHGHAVLYCAKLIGDAERVIVCEGELDCLVLRQRGYDAVTGSAGAETWKDEWTQNLVGKHVVICYDSDTAGRSGADKVANAIISVVSSVRKVDLFGNKDNKDLKDVTDYFVEEKKTKENLEQLIERAVVIQKHVGGIPIQIYNALTTENETVTINAAQDFVGEVFYYAVKVQDKPYLLTSEKKIIPFNEVQEHNLKLSASDIQSCRFTADAILNFLEGRTELNPLNLFDEIEKYIRRFIILPDKETYRFLALWTIGTYVFRVFRYYGYLHLIGEKSSGKTLLMEVLAPICFNGQISVNSTEAVIFRDVQNNSRTLCLDEVEKFRKEDRERYGAVMDILKTGFSKSGLVLRCGGTNKDKIYSFCTYSPKIFAGINDIDDVLRDRTIRIRMVRRLKSDQVDRYLENRGTQQLQCRLRNELYVFGLTLGPEIAKVYNENIDSIRGIEHLDNRAFDVWTPVILLANVIDAARDDGSRTVTDDMVRFSSKHQEERSGDDVAENETVKLLTVLNRMLGELNPERLDSNLLYFETDEVLDYFKKQEEFAWLPTKTYLSRTLRKLGIISKPGKVDGKQKRLYVLDKDKIADLSLRYVPSENQSVTVTQSVTPVIAE